MNRPNPDRRSVLALLGIAGGAFGAGLGGGVVAMAPKAAPVAALPLVSPSNANCVLMFDGEVAKWVPYCLENGLISHETARQELGLPSLAELEHL